MKKTTHSRWPLAFPKLIGSLLAIGAVLGPATSQAQSPTLDPSFQTPTLYQPASVRGVVQLGDGSRIVAGNFSRADGQPANGLARYQPGGQPDAAFNARTQANTWKVETVAEAPGGKLLVHFEGLAQVSGRTCAGPVRLLPNGQLDTAFVAQTIYYQMYALLAQPDGGALLGGPQGMVRLLPTGAEDTTFTRRYGSAFARGEVEVLARQADGKILVGGDFEEVQGQPRNGLARLLPGGALDASYQAVLPRYAWVQGLTVQPSSGNLLCTYRPPTAPSLPTLVRLQAATGALDATFRADPDVSVQVSGHGGKWPLVQEQPSGAIVVAGTYRPAANQSIWQAFVTRLTATGRHDPTWQTTVSATGSITANSLQALPNGQVLVASAQLAPFVSGRPNGNVVLFDAGGAANNGFAPGLNAPGSLTSMGLQADGKIVIAGAFTAVNGQPRVGLARLLPNGTVDATFGSGCPLYYIPISGLGLGSGIFDPYVVVQPDDKIVVGNLVATPNTFAGVLRLLPGGCPDPAFTPGFNSSLITSLAVQPDGKVLASGLMILTGGGVSNGITRLTATGSIDATYQLPASINGQFSTRIAPQPDGTSLLLVPTAAGIALQKFGATGTLDPTYPGPTLVPVPGSGASGGTTRDAAGRQLVFGLHGGIGSVISPGVARVLPGGAPDPTFRAALLNGPATAVAAVAEQPNGRILVGSEDGATLQRLLPDGRPDASFDPARGPQNGAVRAIVVQPNGAILVAGSFQQVGTQPHMALARLLDPNVLAIASARAPASLAAWPVPAHGQLHLALDAAARPQQVQLLDGRGRVVLTQTTSQPELTLNTAALAPGLYLLQVQYAGQTVTRRVVLE